MSVRSVFSLALGLAFVLPASSGFSQALPVLPPMADLSFWCRENAPYTLTLTGTFTSVDGNNTPHTHVVLMKVFRDSVGRVREESSYDSGRLLTVSIKDPINHIETFMHVVDKKAVVSPLRQPAIPPQGTGWTVERLPSRIINGIAADGFRFSPTLAFGMPSATEEEWISKPLGVVLERTFGTGTNNYGTLSVSQFKQVEPDPALFKIDLSGYSVQKLGTLAQ